ncbi:hypothetical protein LI951_06680 [Enterococcus sp. BWT-B8]|uniref:hypothetical protein n=1 Tax=Enterococcus sp. BWT-B8 TaxID=2885157 RepID=UPI001E343CFA|nr:hypothetical protein [Enterococcus sp. BWT-B8]MCB5951746.1 hypothetical protein [Enterococcus sp. BWT-B8]
MKDEYKKQLNQIKAPKSLIEKTRLELREREEQKKQEVPPKTDIKEQPVSLPVKRKLSQSVRFAILAAVLVIIAGAGSYGYYQSQHSLRIAFVEQESDTFSIDKNFGQIGGSKNENIEVSKGRSSKVIPDFLRETEPNKLNEIDVWLAKNEENIFFAGYQKDGIYYFIQAKEISETEFLAYIKDRLE